MAHPALKTPIIALSAFLICVLAACSGYEVTVNNNPVRQPKKLLAAEGFRDVALAECLSQTIKDQEVEETDQLTTLVCSYAGIETLEGIQQFTNLQQLGLNDNNLTSVAILSQLNQLERLNLDNNPGLDCEHIALIREAIPGISVTAPIHCDGSAAWTGNQETCRWGVNIKPITLRC